MTVKELYEEINGNYEEVLARLMNDKLVTRFAIKYIDDPSYESFVKAWEGGDPETIFRAAHTLKGVLANLSFIDVFEPASEICEAYRPGKEGLRETTDCRALVEVLAGRHGHLIETLKKFASEQE